MLKRITRNFHKASRSSFTDGYSSGSQRIPVNYRDYGPNSQVWSIIKTMDLCVKYEFDPRKYFVDVIRTSNHSAILLRDIIIKEFPKYQDTIDKLLVVA